MQDLIAKAATLLEALPYIQKFSGETFVVKYGGSFMDSPDETVRTGVARDIVFLEAVEINPVVVHGGGKAITRAMEKAGLKANFIQGQRVTDEATVQIVDDVFSREINPEVVTTINALGGQAVGFAGPDIFKCRKLLLDDKENPGKKIDIGYVGEVIEVNVAPLKECMWCGFTPVISPTARGEDGKIYNCNADVAAAHVRHRAQRQTAGFHERRARLDARSERRFHRSSPHLQTSEVAGAERSRRRWTKA